MASSTKFFHAKPSYIYPTPGAEKTIGCDSNNNIFEFDEADLCISNESLSNINAPPMEAAKKPIPSSRSSRKQIVKKIEDRRMMAGSLPVNIPDWSKILKDEYREHRKRESDEDGGDVNGVEVEEEDEDEYCGLVPPHEYLAMRRGASFSVHEGIGRTLKGRDLRRVRNAIWKKVGFED